MVHCDSCRYSAVDDPPQPPAVHHVVSELEALGYRWAQRVIGLTGFGQDRSFFFASSHNRMHVVHARLRVFHLILKVNARFFTGGKRRRADE